MYVTHFLSIEQSSANIITHCVDGGIGVPGGVGIFKKSYDVESLFLGSIIML